VAVRRDFVLTGLWVVLATLNLVPGAVAFVSPDAFVDRVASFGSGGQHYVRDLGAAQLALGLAAASAAVRVHWRRAVAFLLAVHVALHAVSHVLDRSLGTAEATWGVAVSLVVQATALLAWRVADDAR
jgi:hypothetical protein